MSRARHSPHVFVAALCLGMASANVARLPLLGAAVGAALLLVAAATADEAIRPSLLAASLLLAGWWWGSARLGELDRSVLLSRVDTAERSLLVTTGPARASRFQIRVPAQVRQTIVVPGRLVNLVV